MNGPQRPVGQPDRINLFSDYQERALEPVQGAGAGPSSEVAASRGTDIHGARCTARQGVIL